MSRRRKLQKFAQLLSYPHVYELTELGSPVIKQTIGQVLSLKGRWRSYAFGNERPLTVELACGRGEYTVGLAALFPQRNFLGVDIKGARIYQGAKRVHEESIPNAAFLRIRIEQITTYFDPGEIDEIWITFPDPFSAKPNRRLTASSFLDRYGTLLASGSSVHLKTDDDDLFAFSVEEAESHPLFRIKEICQNIADIREIRPELNVYTYYERQHLSNKKTIKYLHLIRND